MLVNVAQLLKEPVGSTRIVKVNEYIYNIGNEQKQSITGEILIIRIDRGILVEGTLSTTGKGNCARCLKPADYTCQFDIAEEFVPIIDINTQSTAEIKDGSFIIDSRHNIDLSELLYQYATMAKPMKTLCKEDCEGICPVCGQNLNEKKCNCVVDDEKSPWAKLRNFKKEGKINGSSS
jgi:uncharacterized protein